MNKEYMIWMEIPWANWLFDYGKNYLPDAALSYEVFKDNLNLDDDDFFGAVFYIKNYQAAGHVDKDRSE